MSGAISSPGLMTAQRGIEKDQREVEGGYRGFRAEWATYDFMMDSKYERGRRERGLAKLALGGIYYSSVS